MYKGAVLQKITNRITPYGVATMHLGIYSKEPKAEMKTYLYSHVHSSIIHDSQKVEASHVHLQMNV